MTTKTNTAAAALQERAENFVRFYAQPGKNGRGFKVYAAGRLVQASTKSVLVSLIKERMGRGLA